MNIQFTRLLHFVLSIILTTFFFSCSTPKISRDDALRIKPEFSNKYNINPNTDMPRNGYVLRGEVIKILVESVPDSCPINPDTKFKTNTFVLFVDSTLKSRNIIERIPIQDVELIGPKLNIAINSYNNINYFETYNNPLLPLEIREIPVDSVFRDPCSKPCPCEPLTLDIPCILCVDCPQRTLKDWFISIKPGFAIYDDVDEAGIIIGRDDWLVDITAGVRLGESKRWGLGLILSSGVSTLSKIDNSLLKRPSINLYGRYDLFRNIKKISIRNEIKDTLDKSWIQYDTIYTKTQACCNDSIIIVPKLNPDYLIKVQELTDIKEYEERPCINTFIYGLFGASIDDISLDLFKLNWNKDCQDKIDLKAPGIDISLPLNFGFGIGLEYPLSHQLDLSLDLGFRSISYGNQIINVGLLFPNNSRINSVVFRVGLVY